MSATPVPNQKEATATPAPRAKGPLDLILRGLLLVVAVYAAIFAIVFVVPDANRYSEAMRMKHERLASSVGRKIVLVGGSNLPFGIDSAAIEKATGCRVVNMGMDGYLGVAFMLNEVRADMKAGDLLVFATEHDSYYKSVVGSSNHQLGVVRAYPEALAYMVPLQRVAMLGDAPFVAQVKTLRLVDDTVNALKNMIRKPDPAVAQDLVNFDTFNEYGDEIGHLDAPWPYPRPDSLDLSASPFEADVVPLLGDYADEMKARGVRMMVSYTPAMRDFYDRHKAAVDRIDAELRKDKRLIIPRPASDYVFDEPMFFDTAFHLNRKGVEARTALLIGDILSTFPEARCAPEQNQGETQ